MKRLHLFLVGMILMVSAVAQDSTGLTNPESVISDGEFLYVTNLGEGGAPQAKDSNGYISKLSLDGKMITPHWNGAKLNAPKGTAIVRHILYVADIDRLIGFEVASGRKLVDINLSNTGTTFLNDLTVKDDFTILASATDIGKIIEINVRSGAIRFMGEVPGVNGICFDKNTSRLYTCSFKFNDMKGGEVGIITYNNDNPKYEKVGNIQGAFDGLAMFDDHTLLVSDWGALDKPAGAIYKVDLKTKKATKVNMPVINGPADFYYESKAKMLVIPEMVAQRVIMQQL